MSTDRKMTHPSFPGLVKTVKASYAKSWEAQGWVAADKPKAAKKAAPAKKSAAKKDQPEQGTSVLRVNHQHD